MGVQAEFDAYHVEDQKRFRDEDQAQTRAREDGHPCKPWESSAPLTLRSAIKAVLARNKRVYPSIYLSLVLSFAFREQSLVLEVLRAPPSRIQADEWIKLKLEPTKVWYILISFSGQRLEILTLLLLFGDVV